MRKLSRLALTAVLCATSSITAAQFSANVGVTSNYVWRGVTQSEDSLAVFGGLDYAHDSGWYAGTWASSVSFADDDGVEVDLYGGYSGGDAITYDVGFIYYLYPDYDEVDYGEMYGSVGWEWLTAGVAVTVTSEVPGQSAFTEGDVYGYLSGSWDLRENLSLTITAGNYWFADAVDYAYGQVDLTWATGLIGDIMLSVSTAQEDSGEDGIKGFITWTYTFGN
jgi:uncharacterized protein (TIGR02001 family)